MNQHIQDLKAQLAEAHRQVEKYKEERRRLQTKVSRREIAEVSFKKRFGEMPTTAGSVVRLYVEFGPNPRKRYQYAALLDDDGFWRTTSEAGSHTTKPTKFESLAEYANSFQRRKGRVVKVEVMKPQIRPYPGGWEPSQGGWNISPESVTPTHIHGSVLDSPTLKAELGRQSRKLVSEALWGTNRDDSASTDDEKEAKEILVEMLSRGLSLDRRAYQSRVTVWANVDEPTASKIRRYARRLRFELMGNSR